MGRVVAGETSTTMKVLAILFLATLAYAAPEAEPKADADAAADAWYAYYGHPYRYYGYGGYYGGWRGYYGGYYGYPGYYGYRRPLLLRLRSRRCPSLWIRLRIR